MPRDIELVKQELESSTTSIFITKWILEHTPYVFEDYENTFLGGMKLQKNCELTQGILLSPALLL